MQYGKQEGARWTTKVQFAVLTNFSRFLSRSNNVHSFITDRIFFVVYCASQIVLAKEKVPGIAGIVVKQVRVVSLGDRAELRQIRVPAAVRLAGGEEVLLRHRFLHDRKGI